MARFLATEPLLTKLPSPASGGRAGGESGAAGREGQLFRLTPLLAALLFAYPATQAHRAHAEDTPASSQNSLPDLGRPSNHTGNVSVRPSGVTLENTFDRQKVVVSPEYSNQTGLSIGAALATMLGDNAAVGVVLSAGSDKKELLVNAGFKLDEHQRFILTAGQLEQFLDYAFLSGTEKVGITQNSGGISYQLQLGQEFLRFLEINGYVARTASRDLADKTFAIDTATLYELWNDPRRIAGGKVTGLQGRLGFAPLEGSLVKVSLGQERLSYDLLAGEASTNRLTAGIEWAQQLGNGYSLKAAADTFASQNRYTLGVDRSLAGNGGRHNLGVSLVSLHGRDGLGDDNQIKLTYSYAFGTGSGHLPAMNPNRASHVASGQVSLPAGENLLNQIAMRPGFIPSHVIAKIDNTALPTRLIAVDKTALPAGTRIDTASGDVTAPLGVAVTGIAGVTRNTAAFTNTGQFSLAGNSLVIKPSLIVQPAVGITDTYVVTVNNLGGGTTLVTVLVSHGSIKIDSITVTAGAIADVTAPTTTAGPSVSGTTDTATTLSVTINENGTGYYLVQAAAAAAPTVAAVQAGTSFAMTANVAATPAISGLTASTAYKIYFVAKDAANNVQAAVQSVAVTTTAAPDIAAPTTTAGPSVSGTTDTATTLSATINENGTGYYLVQAAAAAAPTVAAVQAGTSFAMTANVAATPAISGLTASTAYKIYFVAKDAANNVQAAVQSVAVTTTAAPDVTAPTTTAGPTISTAATDTTASVTQTINENGTGYWLMLPAASAVPAVADVKAGTPFAMTANTPAVVSLTGLTASTAYKYYFVAKDAANNDQAAVSAGLAITTTATADTTPPSTPTLAIAAGAAVTNSLTPAITITNDTDNVGVAWWYVAETGSTAPANGAWSSSKPTSYTLAAGDGVKTVKVWTKDAAGNVSAAGSDTITLDQTAPSYASESFPNLDTPGNTGNGTMSFDEAVHSVSSISFKKTVDNSPAGGSISVASGLDSTTLGINYTAPGLTGEDVYIELTVVDTAGNSRTVRTALNYFLF